MHIPASPQLGAQCSFRVSSWPDITGRTCEPALGTPLMEKNPLIGIDLPLKVIVYEDADGKVWLAYTKPEVLIVERYGIEDESERVEMMNKGLGAMTDGATSGGG